MKVIGLIGLVMLSSAISEHVIFDFNKQSTLQNWTVVDDVVMGGRSSGSFQLDANGFGEFSGYVSLENNGGFSSVRLTMNRTAVKKFTKVVIKLKGDGKPYQFRIRANAKDAHSYAALFTTTGAWEEIHIPLESMYPSYRGRKLNQPNFFSEYIETATFLIANKKQESFSLLIDRISLR